MNKKKIIILSVFAFVGLSLFFVVLMPNTDYQQCRAAVHEHLRYYTEHCPTDYIELGYETAERCYEVNVALYDPRCKR